MHRFLATVLVAIALVALPFSASAATLTPRVTTRTAPANIELAWSAATAVTGDACPNDGRTLLLIKNSHAANTYTVTVKAYRTVAGQVVADLPIAVPAYSAGVAGHVLAGPFPTDVFNNGSQQITFIGTGAAVAADLKYGCVRTPVN